MEIRSDRRFQFDAARDQVWAAITRIDRYQDWWPWLTEFDAAAFAAGETWRCVVKPPLPYSLHFDVTLIDVVDRAVVNAHLTGEIAGRAQLSVVDRGAGCEVRLVSDLGARRGALRLVTRFAMPVAKFGHDWVLDSGSRRFRAVAID